MPLQRDINSSKRYQSYKRSFQNLDIDDKIENI